ncbi:hypothetical protein FTO70_08590 [Methanosarcina sp. KYL-1]|nr:hypothetical protein [Methanosarcina sp. KYL-1]
MRYAYEKYVHEEQKEYLHEKIKSIPHKFRHGPSTAKVKLVYPDRQTFAHSMESPIWIEFDKDMDSSTITKDTVIVTSSESEEPIDGFLDAGNRTLMFRPNRPYPVGGEGAKITISLIGTDIGNGAIMDAEGTPFDGDKDGKPGGDFEYTFNVVK